MKPKKYVYDFLQCDAIRCFGDNIYTGKIKIDEAEMHESNLSKSWEEFREKSKPRPKEGKDKKEILLKVYMPFIKVENYFLMLSKVEYLQ